MERDLVVLARHMARCYASIRELPRMDAEDLEQSAVLALLEAEDMWDPNRGVPFARFALARVAGAIRNAASGGKRVGDPSDVSIDFLMEAGVEPVLGEVDWSRAVEAREIIAGWLEEHWAILPADLQGEGLDALSARLTEAWLESQYQQARPATAGRRGDVWRATEGPAVQRDGMFPSEEREDPPWLERPTVRLPARFRREVWKWASKANPDGLLEALRDAAVRRKTQDGRVIALVRLLSDFLGEVDDEQEALAKRVVASYVANVLSRHGQDRVRAREVLFALLRVEEDAPEPDPEDGWVPPSDRREVEEAIARVTNGLQPWHKAAIVALVRGASPAEARDVERAAYERWWVTVVLGLPEGTRASIDRVL